jgi:predicted glutamine amidotransferase
MCRFLAYVGTPIFMEDFVCSPCHSLIHQSMHATEAKTVTNGDGFGVGWYGDRHEPGLYREIRPAWSDENLLSIARQVKSRLFFAHVRAATGTATTRANCHPFAHGKYMFMHNGQIGGYATIRRKLEAMIPDRFYDARVGTTDSEALFLLALNYIDQGASPGAALEQAVGTAFQLMQDAGIKDALRCAAALTDGETLYALRWSSDSKPPTLYVCDRGSHVVVASEPVDDHRDCWHPMDAGTLVTIVRGEVTTARFEAAPAVAA